MSYSRLDAADAGDAPYSPSMLSATSDGQMLPRDLDNDDDQTQRAKKGAPRRYLPPSRRFWADFTLGFADGLTVPFALTAGLSSLGQTETVVYAGLAEVSAGCISMGIGGYLSARQATPVVADGDEREASEAGDEEKRLHPDEISETADNDTSVALRYLAPLDLPADLHHLVLVHVASQPTAAAAIRQAQSDASDSDDDEHVWPVASGLSVALGYLVGGLLPLWPYFFVSRVGDGLRWSIAVCVVALFLFGFIRDFCLDSPEAESAQKTSARQLSWHTPRIPWRRLWKSTFEGLQMVILGSIAAIAAVLCVRWFDSSSA